MNPTAVTAVTLDSSPSFHLSHVGDVLEVRISRDGNDPGRDPLQQSRSMAPVSYLLTRPRPGLTRDSGNRVRSACQFLGALPRPRQHVAGAVCSEFAEWRCLPASMARIVGRPM